MPLAPSFCILDGIFLFFSEIACGASSTIAQWIVLWMSQWQRL
jgi:hypothetical protein